MLDSVHNLVVLHEPEPAHRDNRIGRRIPVDQRTFRLGSADSNDFIARDDQVPSVHARIVTDDRGGASIEDAADGEQGVFVNDERVGGAQLLRDGDEIRLGTTLFRFLEHDPQTIEERYHEAIYWLVTHDPVTLAERERALVERVEKLREERRSYLLVRFDLGADASFRLLRGAASALSRARAEGEVVARAGRGSLAVLVPDATVDETRARARAHADALRAEGIELEPTITTEIV
jgi:GGDEF domain-containing protein